jgi:hypothetical protein
VDLSVVGTGGTDYPDWRRFESKKSEKQSRSFFARTTPVASKRRAVSNRDFRMCNQGAGV